MRVILIDDHTLFREGLEGLLKRRGVDINIFADADTGISSVSQERPDLVMIDLRMPAVDGIQGLKRLKAMDPDLPVVILTTSDEANDLRDCLYHEANGYLLKDMDPDELVAAMRKVIAGEIVVAPELSGTLASIIQNRDHESAGEVDSTFSALSPREMEILSHLAEGQSNKVIARHLGIADGTVKLHVKSILKKLGLSSRVEAAVLAVHEGVFRNRR